MAITFYPHDEDVEAGSLKERLDSLLEGAELYHAAVLDATEKGMLESATSAKKQPTVPRDLSAVFNWRAIAKILREIRELSEATPASKGTKADYFSKLAEIYEVLRAAKMPKLEAVRIALMNEAAQLRANGSKVA